MALRWLYMSISIIQTMVLTQITQIRSFLNLVWKPSRTILKSPPPLREGPNLMCPSLIRCTYFLLSLLVLRETTNLCNNAIGWTCFIPAYQICLFTSFFFQLYMYLNRVLGREMTLKMYPVNFQLILTFASGIGGSLCFNVVAALSYSGASRLQCPHLKPFVKSH